MDFSRTLSKWAEEYRYNEPEHSKHNVTCRFLNLFPVKEIIGLGLAVSPESASVDYVVWDAISARYDGDVYSLLYDKNAVPDMSIWMNLDFVISLIIGDADEELCEQLHREGIQTESYGEVYLFEHWIGPTSALMELYCVED